MDKAQQVLLSCKTDIYHIYIVSEKKQHETFCHIWTLIIKWTHIFNHHHQSLNLKGRWGTKDDFATSFFPFSPVLHCPLGLAELQAYPFPDVVFPPFHLAALSSSPFHCALQDGFGQTWWTGNMTKPLQFASFYDHQVSVWSNCLLDLGTGASSLVTWSLYEMYSILW